MKKEIAMSRPEIGLGACAAVLLTRPRIADLSVAPTGRTAGTHRPGSSPGLT